LRHIRSTLASLTVRYENAHNEYNYSYGLIAGSLGPLHDFFRLNALIISLPVLFGIEGINADCHPTLSASLPPALQHLTITDDLYDDDAVQGKYFKDTDAMAFFRAYLSGEKLGPNWMDSSSHTYEQGQDNRNKGRCYKDIDWM
jgi:hypothetical protein